MPALGGDPIWGREARIGVRGTKSGRSFRGASLIPAGDHACLSLVAQGAQRGGAQSKKPSAGRRQSQPAAGQNPQDVAVREKGDVAIGQKCAIDHRAGPRRHLVDRLPPGEARDPEIPARSLFTYVRCRAPFVVTVIPFEQVGLPVRDVSVSGEAASLKGALEGTGQDKGKTLTRPGAARWWPPPRARLR